MEALEITVRKAETLVKQGKACYLSVGVSEDSKKAMLCVDKGWYRREKVMIQGKTKEIYIHALRIGEYMRENPNMRFL